MKELKKQDRTSSRLPTDTERKYKLGQIELTKEELDKLKSELVVDEYLSATSSNAIANKTVTNALNNKVTKEANKGLSSNDFTNEYKAKIDSLNGGSDGVVSLLDVYPVGSIYMSVTNVNPATLFGGTWEQLKDRFLLGAGDTYTNGAKGGEAKHTLTIDEMPTHNHEIMRSDGGTANQLAWGTSSDHTGYINTMGENVFQTMQVGETGSSQPHNNMPPYLVVYIWKRVS